MYSTEKRLCFHRETICKSIQSSSTPVLHSQLGKVAQHEFCLGNDGLNLKRTILPWKRMALLLIITRSSKSIGPKLSWWTHWRANNKPNGSPMCTSHLGWYHSVFARTNAPTSSWIHIPIPNLFAWLGKEASILHFILPILSLFHLTNLECWFCDPTFPSTVELICTFRAAFYSIQIAWMLHVPTQNIVYLLYHSILYSFVVSTH